ncbi:MAG: hypothetical protein HY755_12265 [Nitrospirae bacterium]|nr:hypothetical protein [Nitrospirota bacterium]
MFKMILIILAVIIIFGVTPAFASSATFYYSDGPWSGKIIDAETKAPIEGVVVLAHWEKIYFTPAGRNSYFHNAVEVVTDRDGNFLMPKFTALNILPVIRVIEGPFFVIYKPGYAVFPPAGGEAFDKYFPNSPLKVDTDTMADFFKKGIVLELPKLKTREERLDAQSNALPIGGVPDKDMPALLNLINAERKSLGLEPIHIRGGKGK